MHVGFGNLGGAIAAFTYRAVEKPRYHSGHGTLLGTISMSMCLCIFMTIYLRRENARRDKLLTEQGRTLADYTEAERKLNVKRVIMLRSFDTLFNGMNLFIQFVEKFPGCVVSTALQIHNLLFYSFTLFLMFCPPG